MLRDILTEDQILFVHPLVRTLMRSAEHPPNVPQCRQKPGIRMWVGQNRADLGQRPVYRNPEVSRCVQRCHGGSAALCLNTVQEHVAALRAKCGYRICGVGECEVQVGVILRLGLVDQPNFEALADEPSTFSVSSVSLSIRRQPVSLRTMV